MRDIYDIVKELQKHPDFIYCDIWTKDMIIDNLVAHYETESYTLGGMDSDLDIIIDKDDLTNKDWCDIEEQLQENYDGITEPIRVDKLKDLNQRLRRQINLDKLIRD